MRLVVSENPAVAAADFILERMRSKDPFHLALSGGKTPWMMVEHLSRGNLSGLHAWQVDERVVPDDHAERNWQQLDSRLPSSTVRFPIAIDVARDPDGQKAAAAYDLALGGRSLDLVHLGLGGDGHLASLFPGDPALAIDDRDVVATGVHAGWPRVTLTFRALRRANEVMFLITGGNKGPRLRQLLDQDPTIPAGRLGHHRVTVFADAEVARAAGA